MSAPRPHPPSPPPATPHPTPLRHLVFIFLVALVARAAWGTVRQLRAPDPQRLEFPDEVDYWSLAQSLSERGELIGEHGFRALRMPLYPAFLSLFTRAEHGHRFARIAHWSLGALAALLTALLAARITAPPAALIAGLLVALDPFLIFFSSLLLTETPYIAAQSALLLIGWPLLNPRLPARWPRWAFVGLAAALCIYLREAAVPLSALWIILLVLRRRFTPRALLGGALAASVVIAALLPWAMRNRRLTGDFCWLTHRAGISLYDGLGPQATGASDLGDIKQMPQVRGLNETEWNRYFTDQSLIALRTDPLRVLRLAAVKIARTWNPVPNVDTYRSPLIRLASAAWTLPVYVGALLGAVHLARRNRPALAALLLPVICVLMLHAVFVGSVRYRLVAMPMLEVLAALALADRFTRRKAPPAPESASPPGP